MIKAVKVDEETGKTVLLPDASFRIHNVETGEYVGHWVWFPLPHYVDTYTTDETGTVMTADVLEAGEYELVEIEAPYGYILNDEPVKLLLPTELLMRWLKMENADYSCFNEGCFRKRKDFCNQDWRTPYRCKQG